MATWPFTSTTSTTITLYNTDAAWYTWTGTTTTSNVTINTDAAWHQWQHARYSTYQQANGRGYTAPKDTEEQLQRRKRMKLVSMWGRWVREAAARWEKIARQAAQERARQLLLENLTEAQRETYEKDKSFTVHTKDGERVYEIRHGSHGNISLVEDRGKRVRKNFCTYVPGPFPTEDAILAQKLMIEAEEARFLQVANAY